MPGFSTASGGCGEIVIFCVRLEVPQPPEADLLEQRSTELGALHTPDHCFASQQVARCDGSVLALLLSFVSLRSVFSTNPSIYLICPAASLKHIGFII